MWQPLLTEASAVCHAGACIASHVLASRYPQASSSTRSACAVAAEVARMDLVELQHERAATYRAVMAAHASLPTPCFAFYAVDFDNLPNGRLTCGNRAMAELVDLPALPIGAPSYALFLPPTHFFYRHPEVLTAYQSSCDISLNLTSSICRGHAPRADGRSVLVSRLGRMTPIAFSLAGVYRDGLLREMLVSLWPLPADTPYTVGGHLTNVPIYAQLSLSAPLLTRIHAAQRMSVEGTPTHAHEAEHHPLRLTVSNALQSTVASPPALPTASNRLAETPNMQQTQESGTPPSSDPSAAGEEWHCDFCAASATPERRCVPHSHVAFRLGKSHFPSVSIVSPCLRTGPRGPRTLCNACGIRYGAMRRAAAKAAANRRDQKGRFVASEASPPPLSDRM